MTRSHAHLVAATADLSWCASIPHTVDQVLGIHLERNGGRRMPHGMTNDAILSRLTSSTNAAGFGKGGHSDPTADAALAGEAPIDETVETVTAAIGTLLDVCGDLGDSCARALGRSPWRPQAPTQTLSDKVRRCYAMLHRTAPLLDQAITAMGRDATEVDHIAWLCSVAAETAAWLRTKCEGIWLGSHGDRLPVAVQRPVLECSHCSQWRSGTLAASAGYCGQCARAKSEHGCLPSEAIVRRWDRGQQASTGEWAEAKAVTRGRRRAG